MIVKHAQTIYLFKKINPAKKFTQFTYEELDDFSDINPTFFNKEEILKIKEEYYMYVGKNVNHWNEVRKPVVRFKNRAKIIKEITI